MTDDERKESEFVSGAFGTARLVAMHAANYGKPDATKATTYAITATAGALTVVAELTNKATKMGGAVSFDEMLFAAILTAYVCQGTPGEDHGFGLIAWSPDVLRDAMLAFERVTGRKPELFMSEGLIALIAEVEAEGVKAWEQFRAMRAAAVAAAEREGKPLN